MTTEELNDTARILVAGGKGLLAMDDSNGTFDKRFAEWGIPQTAQARRDYRELIVTTPRLHECISGFVLYDETFREQTNEGAAFLKVILDAGLIPGIKVDTGAKDLAVMPARKLPKDSTDCARACTSISRWERASRNGAPFSASVTARRLGHVSMRTRTHWHGMPRCVKKPGSFPSSNRKC